jgi:serine/threonine protein kinase/Ran GTPase-activating protein (RanGAP) involved in mRNA processing and transport
MSDRKSSVQRFVESEIPSLVAQIRANVSATRVSLSDVLVPVASWEPLCDALIVNRGIEYFDISNTGITDDIIKMRLSKVICENVCIQTLILGRNPHIGQSGFRLLANAIKSNASIHTLDLCGCRVGAAGAIALCTALHRHASLESLDLYGCAIGGRGVNAVVQYLLCSSSDSHSHSHCHSDSQDSVQTDSDCHRHCDTVALRQLGLYGNSIGIDGAVSLAAALALNPKLTTLNVKFNNIQDEGCQAICHALASNTTLACLNLERNGITQDGIALLLDTIEEHKDTITLVDVRILQNGSTAQQNEKLHALTQYIRQRCESEQRHAIKLTANDISSSTWTSSNGWLSRHASEEEAKSEIVPISRSMSDQVRTHLRVIPPDSLHIKHRIGEGFYGAAYLAEWNVSGPGSGDSKTELVVIKTSHNHPGTVEWSELSTLLRIPDHPNVLAVLGICLDFEIPEVAVCVDESQSNTESGSDSAILDYDRPITIPAVSVQQPNGSMEATNSKSFSQPAISTAAAATATTAATATAAITDPRPDVGQTTVGIVTQYLQLGDLKTHIRSCTRHNNFEFLSLVNVRQILLDAATALQHLHTNNVVHRDVAARNCLLSSVHPMMRVVLCDFGLSGRRRGISGTNSTGSNWDSSTATSPAKAMPVRWMAPEAIQGQIEPTGDIWMLGILFWQLLDGCRRVPHESLTHSQVLQCAITNSLTIDMNDPQLLRPANAYPDALVDIISKCLLPDASDRPSLSLIISALSNIPIPFDTDSEQ